MTKIEQPYPARSSMKGEVVFHNDNEINTTRTPNQKERHNRIFIFSSNSALAHSTRVPHKESG